MDIICVKGYIIDGVHDCDENCELQVGISHGNCYAECLKWGSYYIETKEGLLCHDCLDKGEWINV